MTRKTVYSMGFVALFLLFFQTAQAKVYHIGASWTSDENSVPAILFHALSAGDDRIFLWTKNEDEYQELRCSRKMFHGKWAYDLKLIEQSEKERMQFSHPSISWSSKSGRRDENATLSIPERVYQALSNAYAKKEQPGFSKRELPSGIQFSIYDGNLFLSYKDRDQIFLSFEKLKLDEVAVDWEMENPWYPETLRVGTPLYNFIRDGDRLVEDSSNRQSLFELEKWSNVGPNDILVLRSFNAYGTSLDKGDVQIQETGVKYFLIHEGRGLVELALEPLLNSFIMGAGKVGLQPTVEIFMALSSNEELSKRLHNDWLAVWDSTKGTGYSLYDIFDKAAEGDVVRSLKAVVRIPFNGADLGLTLANKVLSLPFELLKSGYTVMEDVFIEDQDDALLKRIEANNAYEIIDMKLHGKKVQGWANFHRLDWVAYYFTSANKTYGVNGKWQLIRIENERYFYSEIKLNGEDLVFIGTVDGDFDIDIEGKILPKAAFDALASTKTLSITSVRRAAVGWFHFDD